MALQAKASSENIPKGMRRINPANWFKGVLGFIKASKNEIKRITWPGKDKVIRSSTIVIASLIIISGVIWLIDSLFNFGLGSFVKLLR